MSLSQWNEYNARYLTAPPPKLLSYADLKTFDFIQSFEQMLRDPKPPLRIPFIVLSVPSARTPNRSWAPTASRQPGVIGPADRAVNVRPNTYPAAVAGNASLTLHDGVLLWPATPGAVRGTTVLVPASSRLAFTFGFTPCAVETDAGEGVVAGDNTLTILGVTYRRTNT